MRWIYTHKRGNVMPSDLILLLPFFNFGQKLLQTCWDELERRIEIIKGYKDTKIIW